jgi:hypothetical protein
LDARSRKGDVFQIRNTPAAPVVGVSPMDVYEIRAKQPGFYSPIHHNVYTFDRPRVRIH